MVHILRSWTRFRPRADQFFSNCSRGVPTILGLIREEKSPCTRAVRRTKMTLEIYQAIKDYVKMVDYFMKGTASKMDNNIEKHEEMLEWDIERKIELKDMLMVIE